MTKFAALQQELKPGEKLLWSEEADAMAYLNGSNVFGLVFAFVWMAAVGFGFFQSKEPSYAMVWFAGFIGVWILGSNLWAIARALFTLYGVSNQRLLIVRHYPWNTTSESYGTADIKFLRKTRRRSGAGDIVFTTTPYTGSKGRIRHEDVGFFGVDDADAVEQLIRQTFRPSAPHSGS